jgi:tetratricopeptide (TPR) repeat protein
LIASGRDDRVKAREHLNKITEHPLCRKKACLLLAALSEDDLEAASKYRNILEQFPPDLPWPDPFEGEMARYKVNRFARIQEYQELDRQGKREEAIALLRRFMAESPDGEICLDLGIELFKKNEFKEAVHTLRVALSINPQFGLGHYYLGASLLREGEKILREGKPKEAMDLFRQAVASEDQAIALEANLGEAFEIRGLALKKLGQTGEAIQSFREARLVRPDSIIILIDLGETLAEAGEMREAQAQLEEAVRLAKPDDKRPREVLEKWRSKFKSP